MFFAFCVLPPRRAPPCTVSTAPGLVSHVHSMALQMLSAISSVEKGSFICFQIIIAALPVLVQYPGRVSSSFLVNLNGRFIAFVSLLHDVLRPSGLIEKMPWDLELLLEGNFVKSCCCPDLNVVHHLRDEEAKKK